MMMTRRTFAAAAVSLAAGLVVGCGENNNEHRNDKHRKANERIAHERVGPALSDIPRDAKRIDADYSGRLHYQAGHDGRIWLYDSTDDLVIYSGKLLRDERFVVEPEEDRLSINGKRIGPVNLHPKHRYRLYFDRA